MNNNTNNYSNYSLTTRNSNNNHLTPLNIFNDWSTGGDFFSRLFASDTTGGYVEPLHYQYYTRINDENGNATYEFKLPGYKKEEVSVKVDNELLIITADSKVRGKVSYSVSDYVFDPNCIDAKLEDGILTVNVSKPDRLKAKAIIVK